MNSKLHQQAREIISNSHEQDRQGIHVHLTQLNLTILLIGPSIWNMLLLLTRSVMEVSKPLETLTVFKAKQLHCFYTLFVLLLTTITQYNTPVHIVLTDLLDSHIGSM